MKKLLFTLAVITATLTQAQQEIKLDISDALVLKTVEVSYEKYVNEQTCFVCDQYFVFDNLHPIETS